MMDKRKFIFIFFMIIGFIGLAFSLYIKETVDKFNQIETINFQNLDKNTINGRPYIHNLNRKRTENGHYIDLYICKEELERQWGKMSTMNFNGQDKKGQVLSETLIRYLSSKGFRKDSIGLKQLEKNEITYIENGCANYKYIHKFSIEARIYNIIWQINTYKKTGNASAQSITQRIEFLKSAKFIIKDNFWFGIGTGDVMVTFNKTLEKLSPKLEAQYRNRVHNQYIVEIIALGIIGFIVFMFAIIYPIFRIKIWKNYLFSIFYLIILLSFFTDNPLETQLGVSFFSYFYCMFTFRSNPLEIKPSR